jgi:thioredoxin-related protein
MLLLWVALAACAIVPAAHAAGAKLGWREWDAGLEEAEQSGRPVLVDVYTQWCGWCKRMDRDVYARPDVRDYLGKKFVTVKLDAESSDPARFEGRAYTSRTLAAYFRITGYPTTLFLRSSGEHLVNVPGYVEPDKFLLLLRYIGDGHMDRGVSWEDYRAQQQK